MSVQEFLKKLERKLRLAIPSRRRIYQIREIQKNIGLALDAINLRHDELRRTVDELASRQRVIEEALATSYALDSVKTLPPLDRIASVPLAIYSCLPPARSGIADATWNAIKEFPGPYHVFTALPGFAHYVRLEAQLERDDQRIIPVSSAARARKRCDYKVHLFVLGNSSHHIPSVEEMIRIAGTGARMVAHFHEPQMTHFWNSYFKHDFDALKTFYISYYPEHASALKECRKNEDIIAIPCHGLRPFADWLGVTEMIFNSSLACRHARRDLGEDRQVELKQLFLPIFNPRPAPPRERNDSSLVVGHFGIPDVRKGCDTLIEACEIISRSRPVKLVFCGWYAQAIVARICPEPKPFIVVVDSPDEEQFNATIEDVDLAVQLRPGDVGESSAALHAVLAQGRPAVVTATGSFVDYGDAVKTVPPDVTAADLAIAILQTAGVDRSAAIRDTVERYSVDLFHRRLRELLQLDREGSGPAHSRARPIP